MTDEDLAAHARAVIDANLYLTLGTVDEAGLPWTTPVYFAPAGDRELHWMSAVESRHSRHIAVRPQVSLVVFDSSVTPGHGRAVYGVGEARELADHEIDVALQTYPRRDDPDVRFYSREEVAAPSEFRMYAARLSSLWVLCPREPGRPCRMHGKAMDHRAEIPLG